MLLVRSNFEKEVFVMLIFVKKIGMTQVYDGSGLHTPVTVVVAQKTALVGQKTREKHGYDADVYAKLTAKKTRKSVGNQYKSVEGIAKICEQKGSQSGNNDKIGHVVDLVELKTGALVEVSGKTKGKGFQGTVKRHKFNTGPKTHGSHNYRQPGSIGSTNPDRVLKGRRMPGHMGFKTATIKKIKVLKVDIDSGRIFLAGSLPGPNGATLELTQNA